MRNAVLGSGRFVLRPEQLPPEPPGWLTWLLLGGRGSGKTRAGAEWVQGIVSGILPFAGDRTQPLALIGETFADVREVMIEGPAGIRAVAGHARPTYEATRRRLVWPNGAVAQVFSAEDPESLRGPQFAAAWCDELAKWKHGQACWDMLQFGLRLGTWPRQLVTTTPRPVALLKALIAAPTTVITHMRTIDNRANLAASFIESVEARYGGTALGRQELEGELIDERQGALWNRAALDMRRAAPPPLERFARIVVAVDPPATSKATSDACGIVCAGVDDTGLAWVLGDHTVEAATPTQWAQRALGLFEAMNADLIVAEVNQGGEMVASVIHALDALAPVKAVRASRGKYSRAEPVAALYDQGRVRHAAGPAGLGSLEDEMCDFTHEGLSSGRSPDRLDALVWALTTLLLDKPASPRIRGLV